MTSSLPSVAASDDTELVAAVIASISRRNPLLSVLDPKESALVWSIISSTKNQIFGHIGQSTEILPFFSEWCSKSEISKHQPRTSSNRTGIQGSYGLHKRFQVSVTSIYALFSPDPCGTRAGRSPDPGSVFFWRKSIFRGIRFQPTLCQASQYSLEVN